MIGLKSYDFNDARVVEELDVDHLPRESRTRLLVALVHDGLGRPLRVPVMAARGKREGPVFGITAVLHGNELNGIPVIHNLFHSLDLQALRGTVIAVVVVNIPAYLNHERTFDDRTDMNHIMPGKSNGNIAEVYAHRFVDRIASKFDYLIDLHTASFGNVNSLYVRADMTDPVTAEMAYLQRPQIILHNPASDHTLRGTAMEMDIPAITIEIGNPQIFQKKQVKASLGGIRRVMSEVGMLPRRPVSPGEVPVLCAGSKWLYTDHGGLLEVLPGPTDLVAAGDVIARQTNIFGDLLCEYQAPEDGIIIGKSVNPVGQTGARILHLGSVVEAGTPPFLERLDRSSRKEAV